MEEKEIGKIIHFFGKLGVGIIELSGDLRVGDKVRIKGHSSDLTETVASIQIEHAVVDAGKPGDKVGITVQGKVHEHDKVYKIIE